MEHIGILVIFRGSWGNIIKLEGVCLSSSLHWKMNKLRYSETNLKPNASFGSERRSWIIEIHNYLEQQEEEEEDPDVAVCIFNVPKSLKAMKPEAYTPQLLAMGPYHHFHDHLREMERYKLVVAKKVRIKFPNLKLQDLTDCVKKYESRIRASYHKYLEMESESLAWMMVLDGLFLLDFLHTYVDKSYSVLASETKMSHLVDKATKRFSYDLILRDIFMLENQMPILVLKKMLHIKYASLSTDLSNNPQESLFPIMLIGICKEISPFKLSDDLTVLLKGSGNYAHLLDFLYHLIIPKRDESPHDESSEIEGGIAYENGENTRIHPEEENTGEVLEGLWSFMSKCNILKISKILKPLRFLVKLPWKFLSKLPGLSIVLSAITTLLFPGEIESSNAGERSSSRGEKIVKSSLAEEIMIPSVSALYEAGVEFCITPEDIYAITFDTKTKILYLPIVSLDVNSEVILRNLVAYEAMALSGPLVLARYVEFMNGIVDTAADAKLLREKKIIINKLKSDKEVADFWNGMSKSVRLTKVSFLDKAIEDINAYYHNTWKVKTHKYMKSSLRGSWQMLVILATILFLCLMAIQAFCSVYSCPRLFHIYDSE